MPSEMSPQTLSSANVGHAMIVIEEDCDFEKPHDDSANMAIDDQQSDGVELPISSEDISLAVKERLAPMFISELPKNPNISRSSVVRTSHHASYFAIPGASPPSSSPQSPVHKSHQSYVVTSSVSWKKESNLELSPKTLDTDTMEQRMDEIHRADKTLETEEALIVPGKKNKNLAQLREKTVRNSKREDELSVLNPQNLLTPCPSRRTAHVSLIVETEAAEGQQEPSDKKRNRSILQSLFNHCGLDCFGSEEDGEEDGPEYDGREMSLAGQERITSEGLEPMALSSSKRITTSEDQDREECDRDRVFTI